MPLICYRPKRFNAKAQETIDRTNSIVEEYSAQGFILTLRQVYYQFVSRDFIPNTQQSYKMLGNIINEGRLAGLIDWTAIIDRTRNLQVLPVWEDAASIVGACAEQFRLDRWKEQDCYVEVWIEKDALVGVIEDICKENSVPYFSCRGYTSQSEMWSAAQRLRKKRDREDKEVWIIHFGDHDPSGCDMSRDIRERLEEFSRGQINFQRIALTMEQIQKYNPPPNPAKITDSRAGAYIEEHGDESWELDALEPKVINTLVGSWIKKLRNKEQWKKTLSEEDGHRKHLSRVADKWDMAVEAVS